MKNTFFLALFFHFFFSVSFAQKYSVQWGGKDQEVGALYDLLPISGGDFYTVRESRRRLSLVKYTNFSASKTGKISTRLKGNVALFEDVKKIGDQLVVFLSDRREGKDLLFMQKYDDQDIAPSGDGIVLADYDLDWSYFRGDFDIITSQNNQYFAVIWNVPGKKDTPDKYGFKVFDTAFNEISEGDYKLPFEGKLSSIDRHYLSNTGDYFITVTEYAESDSKKMFRSYLNYKAMHLFHVTPDLMEDYVLDLKGRRVESLTVSSDNNKIFTLAGVYGDEKQAGAAGLFYIQLDFAKEEIINEGFEKFDKDFIVKDWTQKQIDKAAKNEAKGKGEEPQLYNYSMRQTEVLEDGSIVGSMEQYYVVNQTHYDVRGVSYTNYTYFYNDIIAFKIGKSGGFDWLKKINKEQYSSNDGGPFSSYCRFVDGDKINFIFNDNANNYDEAGKFIQSPEKEIHSTSYTTKHNTVALVTLDVFTGEMKRETFFERQTTDVIAVPKLFNVDYAKKEVLLYGIQGKKERFGLFRFGN